MLLWCFVRSKAVRSNEKEVDMFKNFVFATLASFTIFLTGCYDTVTINRDQAKQALEYDEATVIINEGDGPDGHYLINRGTWTLVNDTLSGRAVEISESGILHSVYLKVPISKIKYFEVKDLNVGRTVLLTGGIIGAAAVLVAVASSNNGGESSSPPSTPTSPPPSQPGGGGSFSCPLIYTLGDSVYKLESETFAGAVFKKIERTSYDVLYHLKPLDGFYRIKLTNARLETEYVNEMKLVVVDHSPEVRVIPDAAGNIHSISKLAQPTRVVTRDGDDITGTLAREDNQFWESNLKAVDVQNDEDLVDNVTAEFTKPRDAKAVKIVVSGLNSKLAYFALEQIFALQGDGRIEWYNQLDSDKKERARFVGWLMREGMLHLSVWNGTAWSERGIIPDVGPGVEKTQIAILNIADIRDHTLRIRAEFRTGLWRLDRIAVDYSVDQPVEIQEVSAASATNENGTDVSKLIAGPDSSYYVTINGEYANICFPVPHEAPGLSRTVIAKTRGFYNQWGMPGDKPQPQVVARMLSEPLYSSKFLIPLWLKEHPEE